MLKKHKKIILLIGDRGASKNLVLSIGNKYAKLSVIKRRISRRQDKIFKKWIIFMWESNQEDNIE